jgi:glycosyltransferase involved in cell wall biosynthesis
MTNSNFITLIVACYNVETYLEDCLQSILNQEYTSFCAIVINDGSTDNTQDIINRFAACDPRIISIQQKNSGLSETRNIGILNTTTPWVTFVDGDDYLAPDYLKKLIHQGAPHDLVVCSYNRVYESTTLPRFFNLDGTYSAEWLQRRIIGLTNRELSDPSQADSMVTAWGKLYRTAILNQYKLKFVSTKLIGTEDALFNIQYLEYVKSVFVIDQPLYQYRKYNQNSLTSTYKSTLFQQWLCLFQLIKPFSLNKGIEFQNAFYNRVALSIIGLGLNEQLNSKSFWEKYTNLKRIINNSMYREAFSKLQMQYFPLHWKIFFFFAKYRMIFLLMLMLKAIKKIIKK